MPSDRTRTTSVRALIAGLRPRQWLKNLLVAAAPLAAGTIVEPRTAVATVVAIVIFCAASSGVYLINDVLDREGDRVHPTKRLRPIASGALALPLAVVVGILLLVIAPLAALLLSTPAFAIVVGAYEALQLAYCVWLKHLAVLDIVVVSSGFLLRAIAGAAAVGVAASHWFLLVAAFGSLFMAAGKRYSEKLEVDDSAAVTRLSLARYSLSYLRFMWSTAAGVVLVAYSLWAFELGGSRGFPWEALSIVPFALAMFRYAYSIDTGQAGSPEETVLRDRQLLVFGLIWLVVFSTGVFLP